MTVLRSWASTTMATGRLATQPAFMGWVRSLHWQMPKPARLMFMHREHATEVSISHDRQGDAAPSIARHQGR